MRNRRHILLLSIAAFIAVLPLVLRGPSCGHDFDFHIISWFETAKQFSHGTLYPRWTSTPAWNAGEPRFVFYPPLSWMLGGILGLILPWTWTPAAYTWLTLTAAGVAMHRATRSFATPNAALLAAAIYIANPYTLYTAYERSAYAELLAAAWLPLLLAAILAARPTIPTIAIPVGLLWLTNAPAAVMSCYTLALLALVRLAISFRAGDSRSRSQLALTTILGTTLGLGLAAIYILPAAYERRFVHIDLAILPGMDVTSNFLFHSTGDAEHNTVLRTASIVAVLMLTLTAAALITSLAKKPGAPFMTQSHRDMIGHSSEARTAPAHLTLSLTILTAIIALLLTPLSTPIWRYLPELRFLQFPTRLIAVLAAVFALALAAALSRIALRPAPTAIAAILAAAALTLPAYRAFHQRCYPEDTLPTRLAIFNSANPGTDPTDEYTPTAADNDALLQPTDPDNPLAPNARLTSPAYWLADGPTATPPPNTAPSPAPHHLSVTLTEPQVLIVNLRNYPAWRITINNTPAPERLHRDDGLIAIPLPAGASTIDITWHKLPDQRIGAIITTLAFITLVILLWHKRRSKEEVSS